MKNFIDVNKTKILVLGLLFSIFSTNAQTQIGTDINGEAISDNSGFSVSLSENGSVVAIGATGNDGNGSNSGHVRVYRKVSSSWSQIGSDINGETNSNASGAYVSLSDNGNILAIGATVNDGGRGHVRIFQNISDNWIQVGSDIDGELANEQSGYCVSLSSDGTVVAIGAPFNSGNGTDSGQVRIYKNISNNWVQVGSDLNGDSVSDYFGWSLSLSSDGNRIVIGEYSTSGSVKVFENISNNWVQVGTSINLDTISVSLSADGNTLAAGSVAGSNNGVYSGLVKVYTYISGSWIQIGSDINGEMASDNSGFNVSLSSDGTLVAIGAPFNDENGSNSGHIRIYKNLSNNWVQVGNDINGQAVDDRSGWSVSISGDGNSVATGAIGNDNNGSNSGNVRVFDLAQILNSNSYSLEGFSIYPNPTNETININLEKNIILNEVKIYNSIGQLIQTNKSKTIQVNNLSKGNYFIQINTDKGNATKMIIIN